jgi:hypothetical protein
MSSSDANQYSTFVSETPKSETPKSETPKRKTPKSETPKSETPKSETPKRKTFNLNTFAKKFGMKKCPPCDKAATGRYIYSVFHSIMALVAIYLSFRCNNGFSLGSFFIALLCPYIYVIYVVATKGTCGLLEKN